MPAEQKHEQSLEEQAESVLEECRMVLPGIQALMGFQLIAVFNAGFREQLGSSERCVHLASIVSVVVAIVLAIAPAAYRRLAEPIAITRRFVRLASLQIGAALAALWVGLASDLYLIARMITGEVVWALGITLLASLVAVALWFGHPLVARRRR
jgi:hypothetical protein